MSAEHLTRIAWDPGFTVWDHFELFGCRHQDDPALFWCAETALRIANASARIIVRKGRGVPSALQMPTRKRGLDDETREKILADPDLCYNAIARRFNVCYKTVRRIKGPSKRGTTRRFNRLETTVWAPRL